MFDWLFRPFERLSDPFGPVPERPIPSGGLPFIYHFARQVRGPFLAMLLLGGLTALIEASLFMAVGLIVDMMAKTPPERIFSSNVNSLLLLAALVGGIRVVVAIGTAVLEEQIVVPDFFSRTRWQSHLQVSRQDVSFFDDELAGRVSSKVWQTGQAAGDFMVNLLQIIWFIAVFATTTLVVVAGLNPIIAGMIGCWLIVAALIARIFVPRIRDQGRRLAEAAAVVTGRMVDGYANVRLVKLHAAEAQNDDFIQESWEQSLVTLRGFTRTISGMRICNQTFSSLMLVAIGYVSLRLYSNGTLTPGEVALIIALSLRLNLLLGRLLGLLNGLFRNLGTVQNSAELISQTPDIVDEPTAKTMPEARGHIRFSNVNFSYTTDVPIFSNFNLEISPGEKVGIIGPSGAGKTTLLNLLLRFYDVKYGQILLDGHDISMVTQSSLRSQFGVVSQDTSLLHRSIRENIAYGIPEAEHEAIVNAARRAHADDFIDLLEDVKGRKGYDTFVGERGVKLSGGQRQRIAIARIFLRNAPILLLDEATSALDSEVEAAIQEYLSDLMEGKTVIAIAHRLSTIAHLDRLIVLDDGKLVEDGTHDELLKADGTYARLWERQSGGFLL